MTRIVADVAIAGAGLAGMSLALDLAHDGHRVVLVERRATPGGAVGSVEGPSGELDHGIHLFLSAFTRCMTRLEQLGSRSGLRDMGPLALVEHKGSLLRLPLGMPPLRGAARLLALGPRWSTSLVRSLVALACCRVRMGETAADLLSRVGLPGQDLGGLFWREWILSVFNASARQVDAGLFLRTARFLSADPGRHRSYVASTSLADLWVRPFLRCLEDAGVRLIPRATLRQAERAGQTVTAFLTDQLRIEARNYVWAGPPEGLGEVDGLRDVQPSFPPRRLGRHIVNLRLPVSGPSVEGPMRGWFQRPFQWLFPSPGGEVTLVGSAWSDDDWSRRSAVLDTLPEILRPFGLSLRGEPRWLVQRHATQLQSPAFEAARPGPATTLANLRCCGAWLATGLPLSMESALAGAELAHRSLSFD